MLLLGLLQSINARNSYPLVFSKWKVMISDDNCSDVEMDHHHAFSGRIEADRAAHSSIIIRNGIRDYGICMCLFATEVRFG